jgi:hypothetical protein
MVSGDRCVGTGLMVSAVTGVWDLDKKLGDEVAA